MSVCVFVCVRMCLSVAGEAPVVGLEGDVGAIVSDGSKVAD